MSNAIEIASFNLKEGLSVSDFMIVSDRFQSEFLAKQKGYISRKLLVKDDMWADLIVWETADDFPKANEAARDNSAAVEYLSCLMSAKGSFFHLFTVEKSY